MKLAFLNAENLFLDQTKPSSPNQPIKPKEKIQWLARSIQDINPDILSLCEIGGKESLEKFSQIYLKNQYHEALIQGNSNRNIHIGYLIKKSLSLSRTLHSSRHSYKFSLSSRSKRKSKSQKT